LTRLLDETFEEARRRGRTGLDVFAAHELRRMRADLVRFLEKDSEFRFENGCSPVAIECAIPETDVAGLRLRGFADRIDRTPDGRKAWVIDYKTGSLRSYKGITPDDPLAGGSRLQLPVYLAAVPDAAEPRAFYWFITSAGGFERIEYAATAQNHERYQQTLAAILHGVRSGAFPAHSGEEGPFGFENCGYCDFTRLCSVRRDDEFEAKREEIEAGSWWAVGVVARGGPA
jgi:RecB family exonuclease